MNTQAEKADAFYKMHHQDKPFIIPNPWDIGSARMLIAKGFQALATTSGGFVFSTGQLEGTLSREAVMAHCKKLCEACDVPISADLEDGYADDTKGVYDTICLAAKAGLVGGSIEDAKIARAKPLYELSEAVDRVMAAAEAAKTLPFKFTLTARAENFLHGNPDLADTIKRLQAFQEAGADVLYAPGLTSLDDIAAVTSSVDLPVNVVTGSGVQFSITDLANIGVKRISNGSALFRRAFGAAMAAADEMLTLGTFTFASDATPFAEFNNLFSNESR